jgi:hypothetical protein
MIAGLRIGGIRDAIAGDLGRVLNAYRGRRRCTGPLRPLRRPHPCQPARAGERWSCRVGTLPGQHAQGPHGLREASWGFLRFAQGKAACPPALPREPDNCPVPRGSECRRTTGEFPQPFPHRRHDNPHAGQRPHGSTDHWGINALSMGGGCTGLHEGSRDPTKQPFLQPMGDHDPSVVAPRPRTEIEMQPRRDGTGIMPSAMQGDGFDCLRVCAVMKVL